MELKVNSNDGWRKYVGGDFVVTIEELAIQIVKDSVRVFSIEKLAEILVDALGEFHARQLSYLIICKVERNQLHTSLDYKQ